MEEMILEIPKDVENLALPNPDLLNYYKMAKERKFYIQGEIDETLVDFAKDIQLINMEDAGKPVEERKPIVFYIFSEGGMDCSTWTLIDMIAISKTPVYTVNVGICMSNGLSLLVAGHKRFALPHSVAMYHSGWAGLQGTKEQLEAVNKFMVNQDKIFEAWFNERTNIDPKVFARKKKTDWYLTANEMLDNGIIDKIVDSIDDII